MHTNPLKRITIAVLLASLWSSCTMAKTCTVTSGSVAFGTYDPTSAANLDTIGSVAVECNGSISAVLWLSVGNGAGASYASGRRMSRAGSGTLRYNLYANASRTQVLGDGTGGSIALTISGINTRSQPIWGRVPARQTSVLPGSYTDIVVATITY